MIPRRLISIWLSESDGFPPSDRCTESWQALMPDYEFLHFDLDTISRDSQFVRDAIAAKNWSTASNYLRLLYLYRYGGIYHDIDVESVKSFDDLLGNRCFLGAEDVLRVNNAVMGAVPGHWFIKECLELTEELFRGGGDPVATPIFTGPGLITLQLGRYGWQHRDEDILLLEDLMIYKSKYFYPFHYTERFYPECVTEQTHAIHYWASLDRER